jgi:hypothetical protein
VLEGVACCWNSTDSDFGEISVYQMQLVAACEQIRHVDVVCRVLLRQYAACFWASVFRDQQV